LYLRQVEELFYDFFGLICSSENAKKRPACACEKRGWQRLSHGDGVSGVGHAVVLGKTKGGSARTALAFKALVKRLGSHAAEAVREIAGPVTTVQIQFPLGREELPILAEP